MEGQSLCAALQSATAALAAVGYRAARESHHYRVIQSFAYTIGADENMITLSLVEIIRIIDVGFSLESERGFVSLYIFLTGSFLL